MVKGSPVNAAVVSESASHIVAPRTKIWRRKDALEVDVDMNAAGRLDPRQAKAVELRPEAR